MITMGTTQHTQLVCGAHWLIELDFLAGTTYATTAPVSVTTGGHTYTGVGAHLSVSTLSESEEAGADKLTISVPIVNSTMLAAAMGDANTYRGRAARLSLQLFDDKFVPVGSAVPRWSGYMEPARIKRSASDAGSGSGSIELPCSRAGMARARNYQGLRHTQQQQQLRFPGDLGLQYMQALIEAPALWLSKKFQEQT